jgi:hypothetical protein
MCALAARCPRLLAMTALLGLAPALTAPPAPAPNTVTAAAPQLLADEALIMGGTGPCCVTAQTPWAVPGPPYTTTVNQVYIAPHFPGYTAVGLPTPEQLAPFTGLGSEPFGTSLQQGTDALNTAIFNDFHAGDNVVAFGYSQSATIETMELARLVTLPAGDRPGTDQLGFVMIGDGNNPDGGLLERFAGTYIPSLDASFSGATPADVYPTDIYTAQYDGWADYPQYPLNLLADLNAFAGIAFVHGVYPSLRSAEIASLQALPTTASDTMTNYYLIPTPNLPLLDPLQQLGVPQWFIDLIEPDLRVLVDLGYGNGPANVPTPAQLFPTDVNPITVLDNLVHGAVHGLSSALSDAGLPGLPTQLTGLIGDVETALDDLAGRAAPAVQAFSDSVQAAVNGVTVPAQLADALGPVAGLVGSLDTSLSALVNDQIDPAIQAGVFGIGDALREMLGAVNAPAQLAGAVYLLEQVLPTYLQSPGDILTNGVYFAATGLQDLVANDFAGFVQQLELIPTGVVTLSLFADLLPALGLDDLITGVPLNL